MTNDKYCYGHGHKSRTRNMRIVTRRQFFSGIKASLQGRTTHLIGPEGNALNYKAILERRRREIEKLTQIEEKICPECEQPFVPIGQEMICLPCKGKKEIEKSWGVSIQPSAISGQQDLS